MKEIWKDIKEFRGLYQVSNLGRVKSIDRTTIYNTGAIRTTKGKILSIGKNKLGYSQVSLSKHDKQYSRRVHRLVAEAFILNPNNKTQVNHIDGNKENNKVENLEWCTKSENELHAYKMGLKKSRKGILLKSKGGNNMQEKKPTKKYEDLNDTITPYDYMEWRGVGEPTARNIFNSKGFPRIQGTGVKQVADKRAVLLYELGLSEEDRKEVLKELARQII